MDIIAEILDADRLAEEALVKAEQDRAEMLKQAEKTCRESEDSVRQQLEEYRQQRSAALDAEAEERLKEINQKTEQEKKALDEAFARGHKTWEDEIFSRLTTMP